MTQLEGLKEVQESEPQTPQQIMNDLITIHKKDKFYVLYSGGKDSVCVADFISANYPDKFAGVIFTNTGAGSQETRRFVINYCKKRGWKLYMTWASPNERFLLVALRHGFAFGGNHGMWMGYLKQHTWYYFLKSRIALGENACFISGVRKGESKQRNQIKKYTKQPIDLSADQTYCKPFLWKNGSWIWSYYYDHNLEKTSVYDWLNKSGECHCGHETNSWDLALLEKLDNLQFQNIQFVERMMKIVLERLMKANNVTFGQIANWYRIYTAKNKKLRDSLTKRQKQMVCLTYFNKWGVYRTDDVIAQASIDDYKEDTGLDVNPEYCGESCVAQ